MLGASLVLAAGQRAWKQATEKLASLPDAVAQASLHERVSICAKRCGSGRMRGCAAWAGSTRPRTGADADLTLARQNTIAHAVIVQPSTPPPAISQKVDWGSRQSRNSAAKKAM